MTTFLLCVLTFVLFLLKLTVVPALSYWVVFAPLLVLVAVAVIAFLLVLFFGLAVGVAFHRS